MSQDSTSDSPPRRMISVQEMIQFGERLGRLLTGGDVLALTGDLGTGKTVLTRGVARGLGIPMEQVSSPTFTLIQEYAGPIPLIHVDLYRLEQPSELSALGLEEYFTSSTIVIIEWAERFPQILPSDHIIVRLEHGKTENIRLVRISGTGPRTIPLIAAIQNDLESGLA